MNYFEILNSKEKEILTQRIQHHRNPPHLWWVLSFLNIWFTWGRIEEKKEQEKLENYKDLYTLNDLRIFIKN